MRKACSPSMQLVRPRFTLTCFLHAEGLYPAGLSLHAEGPAHGLFPSQQQPSLLLTNPAHLSKAYSENHASSQPHVLSPHEAMHKLLFPISSAPSRQQSHLQHASHPTLGAIEPAAFGYCLLSTR